MFNGTSKQENYMKPNLIFTDNWQTQNLFWNFYVKKLYESEVERKWPKFSERFFVEHNEFWSQMIFNFARQNVNSSE